MREIQQTHYIHISLRRYFLSVQLPGNTTNDWLSVQTSLKMIISNFQLCSFLIKAYRDVHHTVSIPFATVQCQKLCLFSPFMPGSDFRSISLTRYNWTAPCVAIAKHISDWPLLGQFSGYCSTSIHQDAVTASCSFPSALHLCLQEQEMKTVSNNSWNSTSSFVNTVFSANKIKKKVKTEDVEE